MDEKIENNWRYSITITCMLVGMQCEPNSAAAVITTRYVVAVMVAEN